MHFDSKADVANRNKLLRICMDRGISLEKMSEIIAPMRGHSQKEKEQMAGELISVVESGVLDCDSRHFYHKTEWYNKINQLFDTDSICYDTVRPIVEEILCFCNISEPGIISILSILSTEDALRQMYNWLMEQLYVPNEGDCIAKAEEISRYSIERHRCQHQCLTDTI